MLKLTWYSEDLWTEAGNPTEHVLYSSLEPTIICNCDVVLVRMKGFGMAKLVNRVEQLPRQDGVLILDNRLDMRFIDLVFRAHGRTADLYRLQETLCEWFNPGRFEDKYVGLLRRVAGGVIRDIVARFHDGLDFEFSVAAQDEITFGLSLVCPDPLFTEALASSVEFVLPPGTGALTPVSEDQSVTVLGDRLVYPQIVISFDEIFSDLKVETFVDGDLVTPKYVLSFLGHEFAAGEVLTLDLQYGQKTIISTVSGNELSSLTSDSDIDFCLLPSVDVLGGENVIRVSGFASGFGGVSSCTVTVTYDSRFLCG